VISLEGFLEVVETTINIPSLVPHANTPHITKPLTDHPNPDPLTINPILNHPTINLLTTNPNLKPLTIPLLDLNTPNKATPPLHIQPRTISSQLWLVKATKALRHIKLLDQITKNLQLTAQLLTINSLLLNILTINKDIDQSFKEGVQLIIKKLSLMRPTNHQ